MEFNGYMTKLERAEAALLKHIETLDTDAQETPTHCPYGQKPNNER